MSSRSNETHAVQIFPFLAVLVCTMGSLIFLLLLTTRQVRQRAVAFAAFQLAQEDQLKAEEQASPEPIIEVPIVPVIVTEPPPDDRIEKHQIALAERHREIHELTEKWQLKASRLRTDRERLRKALKQDHSQTRQVAEQSESVRSEVELLTRALSRLSTDTANAQEKAADDSERLEIEKKIAELKKQIRTVQTANATAANDEYQVIPFDPQTGTTRRPILIECTAGGITFLPERITITADDLQGFTPRINPLAAGAGALVHYWNDWNSRQNNPASEPEPYVLLLVRPDGAVAYYVAMKMLESIRAAHGYELIENETQLHLPAVDSEARLVCQTAVERLYQEREFVSRQAASNGMGGSVFGGSPGSGPRRGTGASGGVPGSTGSGLGAGTGSGSSDGHRTGDKVFSMSDLSGGDEVGERSWERVENFKGKPRRRAGTTEESGSGEFTDGIPANETQTSSKSSPMRRGSSNGRTADTSVTGNGQSASSEQSFDESIASRSSTMSPESTPYRGKGVVSSTSQEIAQFDSELTEREPGMPIGQRPGKRGNAKQPGQDTAVETEAFEESANGEFEMIDEATANTQGARPGNGSRPSRLELSNRDSNADRDPNGSKLSSQSQPSQRRGKRTPQDSNRALEPEMLSGRRWGHSAPDASIGFERDVRVDVQQDRILIAEKFEIPLGQDSLQQTYEQFIVTLDKYSREWGRPPQGFYWSPRLKFVVKPEATLHYEQINALMLKSGLSTTHEFTKDSNTIEYGKDPQFVKLRPKNARKSTEGTTR